MSQVRAVSFAFLFFISNALRADVSAISLAAHTPCDAVVYFGWAGSNALEKDYAGSPLKTLIVGSNLKDVVGKVIPKLWERLSAEAGDQKKVDASHRMLLVLWRHPTALFATDVIVAADGNPVVHGGLLCDAGDDAKQLLADLDVIFHDGFKDLKIDHEGSVVSLTNYEIVGSQRLDHAKAFLDAMQPLQAVPAIAVFFDGEGVLHKADAEAAKNDFLRDTWPKVRNVLGITLFKSYAMTAGFEAGNWMSASALFAPVPRTGLLAAIEPKPMDPALLARIPATAEALTVYNFDGAKLYDTLADAMAVTKPSDTLFHQGSGVATMLLGRNFRRAILGPLGAQWVIYTDSQTHDTTVLNHPGDADTASDSMVSAAFGLINTTNAQMPDANVQAVQQKIDGVDLTTAKSAEIERFVGSPTFAVQDGILYLGQSPQAVVTAAKLKAMLDDKDVLHESQFAGTLFRLKVPVAGSIDYCDIPQTAPRGLDNLKGAFASLQGLLRSADIDLPAIQMPPAATIQSQLSPSLSVGWADSAGIYTKSVSPFPLSGALLGDPQEMVVSASSVSMAAAVVVPAIIRARAQAISVATQSRERQLLVAMVIWSTQHEGQFPPDLGSLIGPTMITDPKLFLPAGSYTQVPADVEAGSDEQKAAWVNQHAEFNYLASNKRFAANSQPIAVLVEIDQSNPPATRVAAGFSDGHVEMVNAASARKYVEDAAR